MPEGNGYLAAIINFRYLANAVWTTDEAVRRIGLLGSPAVAAEHEVRMLNRGEAGIMVFEPAYLEIAPGDTVHFRAADRGHNAAAIDAMVPPGGESWAGQLNQDVSITFTAEGAACPTTPWEWWR